MNKHKFLLLALFFSIISSAFPTLAIGTSYTYEYRGPSYYWDNSSMQYDHLEMSFTLSNLLPASSNLTIDLFSDPTFSLRMTVGPVSIDSSQSLITGLSALVHSTNSTGTPTSWTFFMDGEGYLIDSQYIFDPMVATPSMGPGASYGIDKLATSPHELLLWDSGLQGMEISPGYLWKSNLNPASPVPEPTAMVLLASILSLAALLKFKPNKTVFSQKKP